ncbi:hypothetical protein JMJ35_001255 [Cladonia borealis]|uniref:Uncharacterized protein n=1 Tax=Cladonia borealis TaxID=184061 RepID=A0AA39R815_9LECA|nr:hypothetical protein JMJ35_001255 [Cladonia borealis]
MNPPTFCPANQQCVSPDPRNSKVRSQLNPTRAPPTGPRGWSRHRPRSPRVVVPGQKSTKLSHINKRRRRQSPHIPHLRREQPHRDAKPLPSIEESAKKGPFDPYAFVSQPPTPSLLSSSPEEITSPGDCRSDVSPQDGKMFQPHLPPNKVKRELSIAVTPVIKHPSLDDPLQTTQARERKLEENGVVELDRDEYALQRFLKVQGELTELEAILLKGKKKHVFERIRRNATTNSLRGVEEILAENDAMPTPTPSGRPTTLREGTTGEMVLNEQHLEVVSKVVDIRTESSQPDPASTQDAPFTSKSGENKRDRPRKEHGSDHGAVHPSRRHVFDHSEGSQQQEKSSAALPPKPLKRKELPGMGFKFNPKPNPPQDARKHQEKKLPRNLQKRQVDMPEVKNTVENNSDADIDNTVDSAPNWLQHENALEQKARAKRWEADADWKDFSPEQADAMERQGSIPPAKFYGHPPRWRRPPEWRQPSTIAGPTITSAEADDVLARIRKDRVSRLSRHTKDRDPEFVSSKIPHAKDGETKSHHHSKKKIQSSIHDQSKHLPKTSSKYLGLPNATSTSQEEKDVTNVIGHEDDTQRLMRDDRPAVEPRVKPARGTVELSKMKPPTKKRKRDTDVSETPVTTSESPDLPSMEEIIEATQMAATSSPAEKKKKTTSADSRIFEEVVNDAKEQGSRMAVTPCPAQKRKSKKSTCTEAVKDVVNDSREPSTPSRSKKRKKAKETMEQREVAGEGTPAKIKKRKRSGHTQESDQAVVEKAHSETLVDRLRSMGNKEKTLALQKANSERSQPTIPTPEAAKTKKLDRAPPTAPESAVEDVWQPITDDEDPISPPRPPPSSKKKHKSKHHRQTNTTPAIAVDDNTPETIESPPPASPSNQNTHSSFNHLRRRHQSLPLSLTPNPTPPTANSSTIPPQPPPIIPTQPNFYDLNLLAIRTRLSNLEAAVAANPAPSAPTPAANTNTLTRYAALKLRFPQLPRAIPPGTTRLSDAELIQIGKKISGYERHRGAPYAFSRRGRLYADYDYLMGRAGWDFKEKARVKNS